MKFINKILNISIAVFLFTAIIVGFLVFSVLTQRVQALEETLQISRTLQNSTEHARFELAGENATLRDHIRVQSSALRESAEVLGVTRELTKKQSQLLQIQETSIQGVQGQLGGVQTQLEQLKKIGGEPLPKDFINSLLQATVRLRCIVKREGDSEYFRAGSASILGRYAAVQGAMVLMTNAHVLAQNAQGNYECEVLIGEDNYFDATVVRRVFQDDFDFALLKLGAQKNGTLVTPTSYENLGVGFCEMADVELGDAVTILSYPGFQGPTQAESHGKITAVIDGVIYETNAIIDHGSSGGVALLDKKRCALGMPTWKGIGSRAGFSYIQSWPMMLSFKSNP